MNRSEITDKLLKSILQSTDKMGTFGCTEVTIGIGGNERVDYITYDTKGVFRCYEIKSTRDDFYSDAKWSFVGHYNYFIMTYNLYKEVKQDIPDYVGVYIDGKRSVKRAKRKNNVNVDILKNSMIRSLSREFRKSFESSDKELLMSLKRENNKLISENKKLKNSKYVANTMFAMIRRGYSIDDIEEFYKDRM